MNVCENEILKSEDIVKGIQIVTKQIDIPFEKLVNSGRTIASRGGIAILVSTVDVPIGNDIGVVCASGTDKVKVKQVADLVRKLGYNGRYLYVYHSGDKICRCYIKGITNIDINKLLEEANDKIKSEILRK